jgi:hypothetical protein
MGRNAKAMQAVVHELIESGVQGQMKPGDTFGLWTFNEQLATEFPMQRWSPDDNKKLAQLADDFLKKRRFEKKTQLRVMLPPLYSVVKASKAITVILISTGNEPVQGTPFDKEINAIYPIYARELRDAKIPFVTILVGRERELVAYSVNSSLGPINVPQPPIQQAKLKLPTKTNTVVTAKQTSSRATNRPPVQKLEAESVKPKSTNEIAVEISTNLSTPITAPTVEIARVPEPLNVTPSNTGTTNITNAATPPEDSVRNPATEETASVNSTLPDFPPKHSRPELTIPTAVAHEDRSTSNPKPQDITTAASLPKPSYRLPRNKLTEHNAAPTEFDAPTQKTTSAQSLSPTPVVATQPISGHRKLLFVGGALVLLAGILAFLLFRQSRSKSEPSLISRSIDRNK